MLIERRRVDDRRIDKGIVYLLFIIVSLLIFISILCTVFLFSQIADRNNKIYEVLTHIENTLDSKEIVLCNYK